MKLGSTDVEFLQALNTEGVQYLVVGGQAVHHYVPSRTPRDVDVLVAPSRANLNAAMRAMGRFDPRYYGATLNDLPKRKAQSIVALGDWHADVLTGIDGVEFDDAWRNSVSVTVGTVALNVLSRVHLIESKREGKRQQDAEDVALLIEAETPQ